jgi:hypothetical protein
MFPLLAPDENSLLLIIIFRTPLISLMFSSGLSEGDLIK